MSLTSLFFTTASQKPEVRRNFYLLTTTVSPMLLQAELNKTECADGRCILLNLLPSPFLGPRIPSSAAFSEGCRLRDTSSFSLNRITVTHVVNQSDDGQLYLWANHSQYHTRLLNRWNSNEKYKRTTQSTKCHESQHLKIWRIVFERFSFQANPAAPDVFTANRKHRNTVQR